MNTRSHYRNSVLAFPKTAEYGCAIERPPSRLAERVVNITIWIAVVAVILAVCFQGASK